MKIYNLRYREDFRSPWQYMNVSGRKQDIINDIISLRRIGYKDVQYGHFEVNVEGKEVKTNVKNI